MQIRNIVLSLVLLLALILSACATAPPQATASPIPPTSPPARTPEPVLSPSPTKTTQPSPEPTFTPAPAVTLPSFELLGHAGGNLTAVALEGDLAYLAVGARLVLLDVSDPQGTQELFRSEPLPVTASALALAGGRLYWLSHSGRLLVFDAASPAAPALLADLAIPPGGQAIAAQGDRIYIAEGSSPTGGSENALRIYDSSDPLDLVELGSLALRNQAVDLTLSGDRAYVALWNGTLVSVDVSDSAHPTLLHSLRDLHGAYVQPPFVFAVGMYNLAVYDLSADDALKPLVRWPVEREPRLNAIFAGATYGNYLYLFDSSSFPCGGDVSQSCPASFHVLDVSDPAAPLSLSGPLENFEFDHADWARVQGNRLYVRDYHGLSALSLDDPAQPTLLWRYPTGSTVMGAYDLSVRDGFAYLGTNLRRHSLYAYDLSDLSGPRLAGPFAPDTATSGALSGSYLYLSLGPDGLSVVDLSQPEAPKEIARLDGSVLPLNGDLRRPLAVVGETLYASQDPVGLSIIDISDPAQPQIAGSFDPGGRVHDLAAGPEHLYVVAGGALLVLDLSDAHAPQVIGRLELSGASQLALSGEFLVASQGCQNPDSAGGLAVVSLADPAQPAVISAPPDVPCGILDIAAQEGYAVLAAGSQGVLGVDLTDPAAPRLSGSFPTPYLATRVVVDGERIYALDEEAGIYVLTLR